MLRKWGGIVYRCRTLIALATLVFLAFAGVWGTGVFGQMSGNSSLNDPDSESRQTVARIDTEFGNQGVDLVGLYTADGSVRDPAFRASVEKVARQATDAEGVAKVMTYYGTNSPAFVSEDGTKTYVAVQMTGGSDDGDAEDVADLLGGAPGVQAQVGGPDAVDLEISERIPADIGKAEGIAMPVLLVALLIVFGSAVAASMPLLIGVVAVMGAFTLTRVVTMFTEVSIFSLNIITILGLGLAVDYGLFVVGRFREELRDGHDPQEAVRRTMSTAGRTVLVSGMLVTLALCGLALFPQVLLRSMGIGGAAAVVFAMAASLTVLPAVLGMLGHKVNAGRMPWARRREERAAAGTKHVGAWARIAESAMRRPVAWMTAVLTVLVVLALPALGIRFGGVDERVLPEGTQSRVVAESLASDFPTGNTRPIRVLMEGADASAASSYGQQIRQIPGVESVTRTATKPDAALFTVDYAGEASSDSALGVVREVRALDAPSGSQVSVGGTPAEVVDQLSMLGQRMPWMLLMVIGVTFLVLAVGFRSVVVPVKAILINVLSISAAFGVVTWIFQDGHFAGWLNFTPTGYIDASQPVLMLAILFGLSMDYEVFLLSRIRERWLETGDCPGAVSYGMQRTGPIITTAAVLMCIVVGFFSMSGITFIKMIGVGMVVAILIDATLVRLLLVPVTMRLLGSYNWWAPSFRRRQPPPAREEPESVSAEQGASRREPVGQRS